MAQIVENKKKFKVLKFSQEETYKLGWGLPDSVRATDMKDYTLIEHVGNSINKGACLCYHCNEIIKGPIYYAVILNDTFCEGCYNGWINSSHTINYAEDAEYEKRAYDNLIKELENLNIPVSKQTDEP